MHFIGNINTSGNVTEFTDDRLDIETKLSQFVSDRSAFSPNTWRNLVSAMRIWGVFAHQHGHTWFPAEPEALRSWIDNMNEHGLAASTIKQRLASMSTLYKNVELESPTANHLVKRGMRILNREHVIGGKKQGQAIPFRRADLEALARVWGSSKKLVNLRDLAFMSMAYNTMLRVAEVARIRVGDVRFMADGTALVQVGHTKTVLSSVGIVKSLSPKITSHILQWLEASGMQGEPDAMLFGKIHHSGKATYTKNPMSNPTAIGIFGRAWEALGKNKAQANKGRYETWTGHSARVGAAMDLLDAGATLERIMLAGNWSSPAMVLHYLRNALAGQDAMADYLRDL